MDLSAAAECPCMDSFCDCTIAIFLVDVCWHGKNGTSSIVVPRALIRMAHVTVFSDLRFPV